MKRSVINKGNRDAKTSTNIPASIRRAINKKKVSSHQDNIEEKLARMCITPSERNESQAVIDKASSANKPKAPHKKRRSKKSSTQGVVTRKCKTTSKEYEHGFAPVVPPVLYDYLQDAVCSIKRLETHKDDRHAKVRLEKLEDCIRDLAYAYKHILPKNWEYNRATAHTWEKIPYFY